ncbi:hypothetical protein MCAP1_003076 [Malassezia caprae]|uniref:Bromo domain-containing protein n=1 Tax=Malassezia caprae TaxID=1381934 RepID=A0AAF0EDY5_9BASI|nr:hypothetical protein MCAP1_003076 [Malassezia caprae]
MERDATLPLAEQLLLAQIICQHGSTEPDWAAVSAAMSAVPWRAELQHHLTPDAPSAAPELSADACMQAWQAMLSAQGDAKNMRRTTAQLGLAQQLYAARLEALLQQLRDKEQAFDLESGALDGELKQALPPPVPEPQPAARAEEAAADAEMGPASDRADVDDDRQVEQDLLGDISEPATDETERTPHATQATYRGRTRRSRSRSRTAREGPSSRSPTPPSSPPLSSSLGRRSSARAMDTDADDAVSEADRDKSRRRTAQLLLMLYNQVSNHTHANLFHQAIKEADAPDYYTLIKQPMDLKVIKQRIKDGQISSSLELRWALSLMFANALMYNQPGTEVHRMANEMRMATDEILDEFDRTPRGA